MTIESDAVREAMLAAGWSPRRVHDTEAWVRILQREGFVLSERALRIWAEYGGLKIIRSSEEHPSCLLFDPLDAASGAISEARRLAADYGENLSPIGLWSEQYRCYIAESGWVMAVGPGWDWELGRTLEEVLELVVLGKREIRCIKVTAPGAKPFPPPSSL